MTRKKIVNQKLENRIQKKKNCTNDENLDFPRKKRKILILDRTESFLNEHDENSELEPIFESTSLITPSKSSDFLKKEIIQYKLDIGTVTRDMYERLIGDKWIHDLIIEYYLECVKGSKKVFIMPSNISCKLFVQADFSGMFDNKGAPLHFTEENFLLYDYI
ncbi:unnamed protein product [Brachionus calyciflorus]|uniref:Uncharacterized protein n=1 Tax=Brachionus calyciflorus TaxID=104777 RepID=A0A814JK05_9BILA|nr:unnamed protein product [Brachionus calyciflorus]